MREYADFLARKLKESRGSYLDVVIAFLTGWACTDSTKSFSITIRRMLGLPYVGNIDGAYSQLLPRLSSDPAFRSKALEALVLALERDWVRKDLLEVAWKNAARELLDAMKELYQIRKNYIIKMFMEEIERAIMAQEEKTFETVPPPMGSTEEIVLPPQPKEEEIKQIEQQQETAEEVAEESGLDLLIELFESMKTSLDSISDKIAGLTSEVKDLKDYLHLIGESLSVIPETLKAFFEDLISAIKEIKIPEIKVEETSQVAEVTEVKTDRKEKENKTTPKLEIAQKLISELEETLSDEELLIPQKTKREIFVCVGNLSRLGSMLTDKAIMSQNLRWNIKIPINDFLYDVILQGLYKGIPDNVLKEILSEGAGLIIMFPIKNKNALQGIVDQLLNLMKNLKFVVIDSDTPVMNLDKLSGVKIILQKIQSFGDLETILRDKVLPNL